ncbi:MAG: S41 family peptidase [Pseudomonadota bacterium]
MGYYQSTLPGQSSVANPTDSECRNHASSVFQDTGQHISEAPERADIERFSPWTGQSVVDLWDHLATHLATRVRVSPRRPTYKGPFFCLIDALTDSTAGLVADVLRHGRGAVLVGERSAGALLVQRPFDVSDRFARSLSVADYFSHASGCIEGRGLVPDIGAGNADAFWVAARALGGIERRPDETAKKPCALMQADR